MCRAIIFYRSPCINPRIPHSITIINFNWNFELTQTIRIRIIIIMSNPKLYYWNIKARAQLPVLLFEVGNVPFEWVKDFEWPGHLKAQSPFGQVPFLEHGDLKLGQSMAIARYASRKAGLSGDNDRDFAISEQLIEEQNDIYNVLAKAQYTTGDKTEAWKNAVEVELPKHFAALENLLHGDHFGSKLTAGDVAVFSAVNTVLDVDPKALEHHPKLRGHYERVSALPGVAKYLANSPPAYFKRG